MTGVQAVRLRLAASPAAPLHVASARIALAGWLLARRLGGSVMLRIEDAGAHEDSAGATAAFRQDLQWLGLDWDIEARQSSHPGRYAAAADSLRAAGRLYPCFESETELRARREWRVRRGLPGAYDRAALQLTPAQREAAEAAGKRPHWRFLLSDQVPAWNDLALGPLRVNLRDLSDPVMINADGTPSATFAGVVDDFADGITHLVRGEDLAGATAIGRDLAAALGHDPDSIAAAHLPAMADPEGERLSRRSGNFPVHMVRQRGVEPDALVGILARPAAAARPSAPAELVAEFDPARFGRSVERFEWRHLLAVNRQALARLPFAGVAQRLPRGATEAFWHAVRGSLDLLNEARGYWDVVAGIIIPPVIEGEAEFLRAALEALPAEPWDDSVWITWTEALKQRTGRAGKSLTLPLRLALTGEHEGPNLRALLPLIGRPRAAQRLAVAAG